MPATKRKTVPLSKAGYTEAMYAVDWSQENRPDAWEAYAKELADNGGTCRMAYLRRVKEQFRWGCREFLPKASVSWTFQIDYHGRQVDQEARHDCFPLVLLQAMMEFLRPSGTHHLAEISVLLKPDTHTKLERPKEEAS